MSAVIDIRPAIADEPPAALPADRLAEHCAAELARFAAEGAADSRYGYQLFRRALVERDPRAWEALATLHGPQLARWALRHPLYAAADEEADAFANQALARLWRQVGPTGFGRFPTLARLLAYLQRCVHSLVVDQARRRACERRRAALGEQLAARPAATVAGWALVRAHCRGEREARLAYGALVLGLPPRELLALDEAAFGSVATINAGLAALRKRLRRRLAPRQCYRALAER